MSEARAYGVNVLYLGTLPLEDVYGKAIDLFRQQVQGPITRQRVLECLPELKRHLEDSPRKRTHQWQRVVQLLVGSEITEYPPEGGKSRNDGPALTATLAWR